MSSADLIQRNGFGSALCRSMKVVFAACRAHRGAVRRTAGNAIADLRGIEDKAFAVEQSENVDLRRPSPNRAAAGPWSFSACPACRANCQENLRELQ